MRLARCAHCGNEQRVEHGWLTFVLKSFATPGIIYTESGFQNYGAMADEFLGTVLPAIPAHRCGTAEEVRVGYCNGGAVVWLLRSSHTLPRSIHATHR